MESEVFTDANVKEVITQYYVPVRLDFDKAENADFAHRNYVWGTPAFLIFDGEGKKIGFMDGFQEKERFLARLLRYVSP
jgi:thioredoxin-related protein